MWSRLTLAVLAAVLTANGIFMLFDPETWYASLESVPHTGPFNGHFVRDIGCAYLAAALGLALAAWQPRWAVPGIVTALTFIGPHAGVHLWELATGHHAAQHTGLVDIAGVYGPPLLAALILLFAPQAGTEEA